MTKGSFGELLKRERELREVTLNEVTVATRIPPRFLEAFEREDWEKLPGGVFNRGFVRAIARYLGLDEENLALRVRPRLRRTAPRDVGARRRSDSVASKMGRRWSPALPFCYCSSVLFGALSTAGTGMQHGALRNERRLPRRQPPQLRQGKFHRPEPCPPPDRTRLWRRHSYQVRTQTQRAQLPRTNPAPRPRRLHLRPNPRPRRRRRPRHSRQPLARRRKAPPLRRKPNSSSPPPAPTWCCWS